MIEAGKTGGFSFFHPLVRSGTPDPIAVMTSLNLGLSALLVVVLSTVTTTFLDVYSAVMSTLNLTSKDLQEETGPGFWRHGNPVGHVFSHGTL